MSFCRGIIRAMKQAILGIMLAASLQAQAPSNIDDFFRDFTAQWVRGDAQRVSADVMQWQLDTIAREEPSLISLFRWSLEGDTPDSYG